MNNIEELLEKEYVDMLKNFLREKARANILEEALLELVKKLEALDFSEQDLEKAKFALDWKHIIIS